MTKSSKHRRANPTAPPPAATTPAANPLGGKLFFVWGWLAIYALAFYFSPLTSAPPAANGPMRRGQLWNALILGDESFAHWFEGCTLNALAERAMILSVAGGVLFVATVAGWICLRALGVDRRLTQLEAVVFASGVGLNLASMFALVLGLVGRLRLEPVIAAGVATLLAGGVLYGKSRRHGAEESSTREDFGHAGAGERGEMSARWLWLVVPFVLAILGSAMLPPADFDVREYHLQAPKEFYESGRVTFLPHNVYANMPLGTEMLSLLGMIVTRDWWTGALVGKTLIACFAPLAALALYAAGCRFASRSAGILAAVVYISTPWIAMVSTQGLVEGAFAFYLLLAFYAVLLWSGNQAMCLLALGGFLAGSAVSVKYPAVLYCVLPLSTWIAIQSIGRARSAPRVAASLVVFFAACAAGCGLWLAKNAVQTGNPTFPLLAGVFGNATRTAEQESQWAQAHTPPNYGLADLARRAVDVTLASDWLSPLVVPLAALALCVSRRQSLVLLLAGYFAFVLAGWWLLTHRIDRFWIPAMPLAALLAGIGATWSDAKAWRWTLALYLAIGLSFDFVVIAGGQLVDNRYLADLETLRTDPQRVEPWHRYLNEHHAEVTGVLLVGDAQPFDLEVPTTYNTVFDENIFERIARDRTPQEVRAALLARKISHIYVSWREVDRYRSKGNYGITDFLQPKVFDDLRRAGMLELLPPIADDSGQMFRVLPPRGLSRSPH